jgi:hypothetical protein
MSIEMRLNKLEQSLATSSSDRWVAKQSWDDPDQYRVILNGATEQARMMSGAELASLPGQGGIIEYVHDWRGSEHQSQIG